MARAAIAAGKHVYTEKPLATTFADAAAILAAAAAAGVRVGAAPDTFLGGGLRTARAIIDEGGIGTPLLAFATVRRARPGALAPEPGRLLRAGRRPAARRRAEYYVTALVDLLGPVRHVAAAGIGVGSERRVGRGAAGGRRRSCPRCRRSVVGTLEFASGAVAGVISVVRRRRDARRRSSRCTARPVR